MLNGLAGKIFGIISTPANEESDQVKNEADLDNLEPIDENRSNFDDDDEWELVDDDENSERSSVLGELELIVAPSSTDSSGSNSPMSTAEALGWNLTPPPCFVAPKCRGGKNKNSTAGGIKFRSGGNNDKSSLEISIFENMLIEHPSMSVYQLHGKRRPPMTADQSEFSLKPTPKSQPITSLPKSAIKKENINPVNLNNQRYPATKKPAPAATNENSGGVNRVESKLGSAYALTGNDVTNKCPAANQQLLLLQHQKRLEIQPSPAIGQDHMTSTNRGMKRQNFTAYDSSLFGKGKQRKNRIKNFSGRSNDRRRQ